MKNKKTLITVIFSAVCAVIILAVLIIGYKAKSANPNLSADLGTVRSFDSLEEAVERAGFSLQCSDRLNGMLANGYQAGETSITVTYGDGSYIRKSLIMDDDEHEKTEKNREKNLTSSDINGMTVWFTGDGNAVTQAEWSDNGYDYVVSLGEKSVSAANMTDYILATR